MDHLTPWTALGGGALIGLAASVLLVANGRIAGISGIVGDLLAFRTGEIAWRVAFLGGLFGGAVLVAGVHPEAFGPTVASAPRLIAAGLLVGVGTRYANGCTSGHGVCGIPRSPSGSPPRRSPPSPSRTRADDGTHGDRRAYSGTFAARIRATARSGHATGRAPSGITSLTRSRSSSADACAGDSQSM